jgi:hypothetical protein
MRTLRVGDVLECWPCKRGKKIEVVAGYRLECGHELGKLLHQTGIRCQGRRLTMKMPTREYRCSKMATDTRRNFRWGRDGEPSIVHLLVPLCRSCAGRWDANAAEARAEALGS